MVWCGVLWCGVLWCGVLWSGVVLWCGRGVPDFVFTIWCLLCCVSFQNCQAIRLFLKNKSRGVPDFVFTSLCLLFCVSFQKWPAFRRFLKNKSRALRLAGLALPLSVTSGRVSCGVMWCGAV